MRPVVLGLTRGGGGTGVDRVRAARAPPPHPGRSDGAEPVVFRERAGFQSNAQPGDARSTGNLRARGG